MYPDMPELDQPSIYPSIFSQQVSTWPNLNQLTARKIETQQAYTYPLTM